MNIREACIETDLPGIAQVVNTFETHPVSLGDVRTWFNYALPERKTLRLVSVDRRDSVTGYAVAVHEVSMPEHHFYAWVGVEPGSRYCGVGSRLWSAISQYMQAQGAAYATSEVRDDDPVSLRFAENRGFSIDRHIFESVLDLTAFDETPFLPSISSLEKQGFCFCSFADFPDTPETRYKLYELNATNDLDIPGVNNTTWTYPQYTELVFSSAWFRAEGQLLAVHGSTWVGLAAVMLNPGACSAYNAHTGVLCPYRGRKIAQALKVMAVRYARQEGALILRTNNDSQNEAILAINRKMGYVPQSGKYMLKRRLSGEVESH